MTDFGLARAMDEEFHLSQPDYMSPEQVDGKPLTPASDNGSAPIAAAVAEIVAGLGALT
jgi:hypothetical protein